MTESTPAAKPVHLVRGEPDDDEIVALLAALQVLARRSMAGRDATTTPAGWPGSWADGWPGAAGRQTPPWPAVPAR
jgi:Acyl-CoA carboxylase epsilon subunit